MKPKAPSELINKFLKGECSQEEEERLYQWYNSFDIHPDPTSSISDKEKVQLKQRMFEQIKSSAVVEHAAPPQNRPRIVQFYFALATAAAMLLLVFSVTFYFQNTSRSGQTSTVSEYVTVRNNSNTLTKYVFPDGSVAWMRPSTQIRYRRDFNNSVNRSLAMEGEAFFEVTKNPKHPFVIKTGEVYTKVLGTSFNVRSYGEGKSTEVSVVTGKVMVYTLASSPNKVKQETFLLPKEKVVAAVDDSKFEKKAETSKAMDMWQKESLSFDNVLVENVVKALSERFHTNIEIKDPIINKYQLKADFTDVNLPSVLELLSKSLGIAYEINNNGISMSKPTTN